MFNHVACVKAKLRNKQKLSILNVILRVKYNLLVKQIFAVAKTWEWRKMQANFIVGMYQGIVGERDWR